MSSSINQIRHIPMDRTIPIHVRGSNSPATIEDYSQSNSADQGSTDRLGWGDGSECWTARVMYLVRALD